MSDEFGGLRDDLRRATTQLLRTIQRGRAEGWLQGSENAVPAIDAPAPGPSALTKLSEQLELSRTERDTLATLVGYELDARMRCLIDELSGSVGRPTLGAVQSIVYTEDAALALRELAQGGRLAQLVLVEHEPGDETAAWSRRRVRAVDRALELAMGTAAVSNELADVGAISEVSPGMLANLVFAPADRDTLERRFRASPDGINIIQGSEGTGRRTLLAAAVASWGKRALVIDARRVPVERAAAHRMIRVIARECHLLGLVPVFRNLDAITDHLDLVEEVVRGPVLATSTQPVTRRWARPPTIIPLDDLPWERRAVVWKSALPTASAADAETLANMYPLSPALIVAVADAAKTHCGDRQMEPEHIQAGVRAVLDQRMAGLASRIEVSQTWDDLVLPDDQTTAILDLLARVRERGKVFEQWGFGDKVGRGLGTIALFSGPPGTGKTMAAGLIAKALHVELYQVDLSKIVSKWIGETEKNLAALFDAAEAGHATLLFDEADALFGKRTEVKSSNDRHANQEVNYLLQRLEAFRGICILTTNHETAIDAAFRRRLSVHVRFPMPDVAERMRLWQALLPTKAPRSGDIRFGELAEAYELSGGYIRNAVLRAAFLAADESGPITHDHLVRAARLEIETMGRVIAR